jgi:hypothetical protein
MRNRVRMGKVRRVKLHGRKVLAGSFIGAELLWVIVDVVVARSGRRSRSGSARRHVDNECFVDRLTARIIGIEGLADGLLWAQSTLGAHILVVLFATDYFEGDIGGIDASPEGIGIFLKNDIADIIDQVVFGDFDSCRGGACSSHPYLSLHRACRIMSNA